jgi:hypothetical protein
MHFAPQAPEPPHEFRGIAEAVLKHENESMDTRKGQPGGQGGLGASLVARRSDSCFAHSVLAARLHLRLAGNQQKLRI